MVESERKIISDLNELDKIFKPELTGEQISDKFLMPVPGDNGKVVRLQYIIGKDGALGIVDKVKNPKFKGVNQEAEFMNIEELTPPDYTSSGIIKRMGLSESMKNSLKRLMNTKGWKPTDLPGKVVHITASWWTKAPIEKRSKDKNGKYIKCKDCAGAGCINCDGTGYQSPAVFNCTARDDLMKAVTGNKGSGDEF